LKKRNYTTLRALQHIAEALKIQLKRFGFAGTKDKNAVTEQVISVRGIGKEMLEKVKLKDIEIKFLGKGEKPASLGDLEGNYFEIIVRECGKKPKKLEKFRNLFGEQRFSKNNAEVGKAIVKKDFERAVSLISENKGDNEQVLARYLKQNPKDFVGALRKIPIKILKMYVHAYQSCLWNRIAEKSSKDEIQIIGFGTETNEEIDRIMKEEGISTRDFIIKGIPELSSEGGSRKVFAEVKDLKTEQLDKKTEKLSFFLPKGCYATELVRQMFSC
ncbi:tRNA pseudouridine(13) synthase TruD, partial [Candidatus Woesearchaeota archaeon]|nr:tRNA pseudouridine(13) synthase TruD [Candidatus Woesearchaeota archaeon]